MRIADQEVSRPVAIALSDGVGTFLATVGCVRAASDVIDVHAICGLTTIITHDLGAPVLCQLALEILAPWAGVRVGLLHGVNLSMAVVARACGAGRGRRNGR